MSQMRGFGGLKTKSLVSSYASCKPARQHTLQLTVWLLLHSSVLICMQYPINISAFNPKLDNIRGTWMSSVSERLLKEIKLRLAPSKYLSANIKNAILLFSGLLLEFFFITILFQIHDWEQSFIHKLLFRKHVSSWSPVGYAKQSKGKQVPVLRLCSANAQFRAELHTSLPFCQVHLSYELYVFFIPHINCIMRCPSCLDSRLWSQVCPGALTVIKL